ncbi:MAG: FAD binding domain-containing protein [Treponema sp.]|nr:FAD binding domain-containing protein [Treponema sp.]
MDAPLNQVIIPLSAQELFSAWNRFPEAVLYAGGTDLIGKQENNIINLPPAFLCLEKLTELQKIARTEHFLDIGSMVKLNRILNLGKIVPGAFYSCVEKIAGFQLRNLATIGGNICSPKKLLDLSAPLTALDAQYEFKNSQNITRWVLASRFHSQENQISQNKELLTRIRLPIHQWDYAVYRKFVNDDYYFTEALVFLAKTSKNILSEIRVIYKSDAIYRNKSGEDILNGKALPLYRKTADDFVENWRDFLDNRSDKSKFSKISILNSIRENVYNLSE